MPIKINLPVALDKSQEDELRTLERRGIMSKVIPMIFSMCFHGHNMLCDSWLDKLIHCCFETSKIHAERCSVYEQFEALESNLIDPELSIVCASPRESST